MAALLLGSKRLAYVVEKTRALCKHAVRAQLIGDYAGKQRHLDRVAKHVLTVAGTVFQPSEQLYKLAVQTVYAGLKRCLLARLFNGHLDLVTRLFHHFLNAGGVDTSVGYELFKRYTRDLAAYGIKA